MDYTVGSVADIISGSKTLNKPKVVRKKIKTKCKPTQVTEAKKRSISPQGKDVPNKRSMVIEEENVGTEDSLKNENSLKVKKNRSKLPKLTQKIKVAKPLTNRKRKREPVNNEQEDKCAEVPATKDEIQEQNPPENNDMNSNIDIESPLKSRNSNKIKRKSKLSQKVIHPTNPEHVTIFVGNLPIAMTHRKLQKMFSKCGSVVNARIRGVPVADPKIPKKVAAITKQFHPERKSVNGYVTFTSLEEAQKALVLNGKEYKGHHIRVNITKQEQTPDKTRAIFLGNVSFVAEEEELWQLFSTCGEIESVRLVRDRFTDVGKGFGYINFKSPDSVELALQMGEVKLRDRVLRISLYNSGAPKKQKQRTQQRQNRKLKLTKEEASVTTSKPVITDKTEQFQGKIADIQKKKKFNKGNQQKKKLAKKIAPKTMTG